MYEEKKSTANQRKEHNVEKYTVFRKKTPTHIFFHIPMSDV